MINWIINWFRPRRKRLISKRAIEIAQTKHAIETIHRKLEIMDEPHKHGLVYGLILIELNHKLKRLES